MQSSGSPFLRRRSAAFRLAALALVLAACSATPRTYEGAFSDRQRLEGNSDAIAAPLDQTWNAALEVLSRQGFLIQQADPASRIILASRDVNDEDDDELTYSVSATLTLLPVAEQTTRVLLAANQTTEMHTQEHTWWHLLWLIPVFPTGTEYTTVVVDRDTVQSPQFYADFFDAVKRACHERMVSHQVAARP